MWSAALVLSSWLVCTAHAAESAKKEEKKQPAPDVPRLLMRLTSPDQTQLCWRNGEKLQGELSGAGDGFLAWKTDLFSAPLRLKNDVIQRVDFSSAFIPPEGAFRIVLADGSHLTGDLDIVDGRAISFQTKRSGRVFFKPDQIVCVERISGPGIIAAGPQALLPARSTAGPPGAFPQPLLLAPAGRVASLSINQTVQLPLDLPAECGIELNFVCDAVPEFSITAAAGEDSMSVETWGDELVLTYGERFVTAGHKFSADDRRAHLRLTWDRRAGRCALFGGDGALWAEILPEKKPEAAPVPAPATKPAITPGGGGNFLKRLFGVAEDRPTVSPPPKAERGIRLLNKGSSMLIEQFLVSEGSARPAPEGAGGAVFVETTGEAFPGEPAGRHGDALVIRLPDASTREVPLASVRAIRWPRAPKMEHDPSLTDIWFADGNLIRGKLAEVKDGKARILTSFSAEPVTAALDHCRALVLSDPGKKPDKESSLEKLDVLAVGNTTLHGTMRAAGGVLPHFQPVGAMEAAAPVPSPHLSLSRYLSADGKYDRAPALLHVAGNQTLPVTLVGVDRKRIEFAWDAAESHEMNPALLHAVQFAAPAAGDAGFDGSGWQVIGGTDKGPARKGDAIVLTPGAGIGHPFLLQGGDISFRMARDSGLASMRIRLFSRGTDRTSPSINFLIADYGSNIYCGLERGEGQLENQMELATDSGPTLIRFTFAGGEIEMYVNGVHACKTSTKSRTWKTSGTGIILETASLWGNQVSSVKLSQFSTKGSPFMAGPPVFSDDARREALLLPRPRRDDPPRQVLIGRNGDLLRGEIEAMTSTWISFRAGLETFKVPFDRVAAAVWVGKPARPSTNKPPAETKKLEAEAVPDSKTGVERAMLLLAKLITEPASAEEPAAVENAAPDPDPPKENKTDGPVQWLDLTNGGRIALSVEAWNENVVTGRHPLLGRCRIPVELVHRLSMTAPPPAGAHAALANWKLENTPDPVLPEDEGSASPLAGKPAADFKLPLLEGDSFSLEQAKGKVVVLDFWATWCGPCVKSLPGLIEAMSGFPEDKVVFVAINQGETKDQVKKFLEARSLKMAVAFDADQSVARKYGVEGIPYTVVIGRDGKVAHVKTGYTADGEKQIAEAVRKAMEEKTPDKPAEGK